MTEHFSSFDYEAMALSGGEFRALDEAVRTTTNLICKTYARLGVLDRERYLQAIEGYVSNVQLPPQARDLRDLSFSVQSTGEEYAVGGMANEAKSSADLEPNWLESHWWMEANT